MIEDVLFCCYFKAGVNRQKTVFQGRDEFFKVSVLNLCSTPVHLLLLLLLLLLLDPNQYLLLPHSCHQVAHHSRNSQIGGQYEM